MAKWAIFVNNNLFKLAATDAIKDDFVIRGGDNTVAKTVTDTQWNDISWENKFVELSNDAMSFTDKVADPDSPATTSAEDEEHFQGCLDKQIEAVEEYLANNTSTEWTSYLNNLKSIDVSSVTLPVDNFQKWFNSQSGFSSKSILELP